MVKSVLFDLDGTLLDRDTSVEQFVTAQYDRLIVHLNHIPKADYIARFIELDCHGHVWKDEVYQALTSEFAIASISWKAFLEDYETQFQFHCVLFCFLTETLDQLKQQGYLLGIISNELGKFQDQTIEGLGIRDYFDVILISEVEQVRKPQPEIFWRATNRLGITVQDSIFIGDHPEADIIGTKNAGIKAIWRYNSHWLEAKEADAIIEELNELPSIVNR